MLGSYLSNRGPRLEGYCNKPAILWVSALEVL